MANDCTKLCCGDFAQTEQTAERVPNFKLRPIDRCNNKSNYFGLIGEDFKVFMPVKATANPGEVEPAAATDDIIGVSICAKTATTDYPMVTVARTGTIKWKHMAVSLGLDPAEQAQWWMYHVPLSKINIYVEFV